MPLLNVIDDGGSSEPLATDTSFAQPIYQLSSSTILAATSVTAAPAAGQGLSLDDSGQVAAGVMVRWRVLTSDPIAPNEGEYWIRGDLHELRFRVAAITYKLLGVAV